MAKKKVKLFSQVNHKDGSSHEAGETVDLDAKLADQIIASRGAVEVTAEDKKPEADKK